MTGFVLYRRRKGLPLLETVKVASLEPLGVEEIEYRSILLAFEEGPFPDETVATVASLAAKRRGGIHVVSLLEVPTNLPIDAELPEREREARNKIERAKLICGLRVTAEVERVRPGQAGSAIVKRAEELNAAAVVLQLRYRNGAPLYGATIRTVLANRPARVVIAATPEEAREPAEATADPD